MYNRYDSYTWIPMVMLILPVQPDTLAVQYSALVGIHHHLKGYPALATLWFLRESCGAVEAECN